MEGGVIGMGTSGVDIVDDKWRFRNGRKTHERGGLWENMSGWASSKRRVEFH